MPQVGLEFTMLVSERAKTIHDLDRATTVIGFKKEQGERMNEWNKQLKR
jgi:hypothetical protein